MSTSIKSRFKRRKNKKGSVLFLTLLFLVLINLFAVAFWKLVPVEMHSAKRHYLETQAYFASDAGIVDTLAFLEDLASQGNMDNYIDSNGVVNDEGHRVIRRTGTMGEWNWQCDVVPGPETYGNSDFTTPNPLRVFKLESMATRDGISSDSHRYREVSAWIKQRSFADFNWNCSEYDEDSPLFLFMNNFKLGGTYRTNGPALLRIRSSDNFWSNSEAAIGGELLFAVSKNHPNLGLVDGVQYSDGGSNSDGPTWSGSGDSYPYHLSGGNAGQPRGSRYEKLVPEGRAGIRHTDRVEMPVNTDNIAYGVWGGDAPANVPWADTIFGDNTSNVRAAINGATPGSPARNGIFIQGDVSQIDFSVTNDTPNSPAIDADAKIHPTDDENQIIKIYQGNGNDDYIQIEHVMGKPYTVPAGVPAGNVQGAVPGQVLDHQANSGKGWTVVKNEGGNLASDNDDKYVIYQEQTNGAIYATGDINGVRGTVLGRRTVAVSTDTGNAIARDKTIRINGDLLQAGTPAGESPRTERDMLGLIAYDVRMAHEGASSAPTNNDPRLGQMYPRRNQTSPSNPNYLYVSIFAGRRNDPKEGETRVDGVQGATEFGGGFGSQHPWNTSHGKGHMVLFGSITEGIRQWKGTGDIAGNSYEFYLDSNLQQVQPPFFPSLPSFDILTWEEKSVFSY